MRKEISEFRQRIWQYYTDHQRILPWRQTNDPYAIAVSEIMLQQTQVDRVISKYQAFLERFPTLQSLAEAEVSEVLRTWQGLGYNRRGLHLQKMAQAVVASGGVMPSTEDGLKALPGIGAYTAGAIMAFAFHRPVVMIETNIRRVFLDAFFPNATEVPDTALFPIIEEALDRENPREWYYALMDYGSYLKKVQPNANKRSKHYTVQSKFEGSDRQIRGEVVRRQVEDGGVDLRLVGEKYKTDLQRVERIAEALKKESFPIRLIEG